MMPPKDFPHSLAPILPSVKCVHRDCPLWRRPMCTKTQTTVQWGKDWGCFILPTSLQRLKIILEESATSSTWQPDGCCPRPVRRRRASFSCPRGSENCQSSTAAHGLLSVCPEKAPVGVCQTTAREVRSVCWFGAVAATRDFLYSPFEFFLTWAVFEKIIMIEETELKLERKMKERK